MYATTFSPSTTIPTTTGNPQPSYNSNRFTVSGARQAAQIASNIAAIATQWAEMTRVGLDAACEARDAAERALLVADCAAVATLEDTIRACAADAWAAAQRAIEADQRVTAAVVALGQ